MDAINDSNPPMPPAVPVEVDPAAVPAQVLTYEKDRKDAVAETVETEVDGTAKKKKQADAGMKNYFVGVRDGYVCTSTS
jgi:hypothetical protein